VASVTRRGKKWRAEIYLHGIREAKTFSTRAEAKAWAEDRTDALQRPQNSLHDALIKYSKEVSPTKKGGRWEVLRLEAMAASMECAKRTISEVTTPDLVAWRDKRLKEVAPGTVRREMNLLASVFEQARREWHWIKVSPLKDVKRPSNPPARRRGVEQDEIDRICLALGYEDHLPVTTKSQEVAIAFLIGIETAMRAGEILQAPGCRKGRIVTLLDTKNGTARRVPLSTAACELLDKVKGGFTVDSASLDSLFRKAKKAAGITDLHFHDSRSEALTRLSKKLDVLELATMVGHSNLKSLLFYYSERTEKLADKLG